ncbi:hypothetical protein L1887_12409 [Cichorium endivia]|nr:hypothetical protein L1887_12409 [Cichorium endivia]
MFLSVGRTRKKRLSIHYPLLNLSNYSEGNTLIARDGVLSVSNWETTCNCMVLGVITTFYTKRETNHLRF